MSASKKLDIQFTGPPVDGETPDIAPAAEKRVVNRKLPATTEEWSIKDDYRVLARIEGLLMQVPLGRRARVYSSVRNLVAEVIADSDQGQAHALEAAQ